MLQEGIRRWNNTYYKIPDVEKLQILSKYMNMLRISGYNQDYRNEVLRGILARIKTFEEMVKAGVRPRARSGAEIRAEKATREGTYVDNWFVRGQNTQLLMIKYTEGSALKEAVRSRISNLRSPDGGTTKIVERGGQSLLSGMGPKGVARNCPFTHTCIVNEKWDCTTPNSIYRWDCGLCGEVPGGRDRIYIGTTSFSIHKRTMEHLRDLQGGNVNGSAIAKHQMDFHQGLDPSFGVRLIDVQGQTLRRYVQEALVLDRSRRNADLINRRSEWGMLRLPRLGVVRTGEE